MLSRKDPTALQQRAPPRHSAATSHRQNDAYMVEMYRGLEEMGVDTTDDPYKASFLPTGADLSPQPLPAGMAQGSAPIRSAVPPAPEWSTGPNDPAGRMARPSDRPLLCMSVCGDLAVVGSADHGLWELDVRGGGGGGAPRVRRELYTKACGHTEWVTCVAHLPDGRVLSGGMDSKLCLWNGAGAPKCRDLVGHTGSVSQVRVATDGSLAVSAAYDKSLRVWSLGSGNCAATLRAHRAPVLQLAWGRDVLASADRDGVLLAWDVARGTPIMHGAHQGHATALAVLDGADGGGGGGGGAPLAVSGGQDGVVRLWDVRASSCAAQARVHTGAVNELVPHRIAPGSPLLLLTAGADGIVSALEPRMGLQAAHRFAHHRDHVYSLAAVGEHVLSGGGDGVVLVHSLRAGQGRLCYGLGANQAAVRAMHAEPHRLVCAGDDGSVMAYDFGSGGGGGGGGAAAAGPPPRREGRALVSRREDAAAPTTSAISAISGPPSRIGSAQGARARPPPAVTATAGAAVGAGAGGGTSAAQAYAAKKRAAMERAAAIKAERQAAAAARGAGGGPDQLDHFMGGGGGGGGGGLADFLGGPPPPPAWRGAGGPQWNGAAPTNEPDARTNRQRIDDMFGVPMPSGPGAGGGGEPPPKSELDMLHELGDAKFGRPRRR